MSRSQILSIEIGNGNVACRYPGPNWVKAFDTEPCHERFYSTLDVDTMVATCNLLPPYEAETLPSSRGRAAHPGDPTKWLVYEIEITTTAVEPVGAFSYGETTERFQTLSHTIYSQTLVPIEFAFDDVPIAVTSDHSLEVAVVGLRWDFFDKKATVDFRCVLFFFFFFFFFFPFP